MLDKSEGCTVLNIYIEKNYFHDEIEFFKVYFVSNG